MVRRVMEVGGLVKRCRRGAALGLLAWAAGAAGEGTGQIELVDGSVLKGRFLEMTPERGVVWGHPAAAAPFEVNAEAVRLIALSPQPGTGQSVRDLVRFSNGDQLPGRIEALDDAHLRLHHAVLGELRAPRNAVVRMVYGHGETTVLFQGPGHVSSWTAADGGRVHGLRHVDSGLEFTGARVVQAPLPPLPDLWQMDVSLRRNPAQVLTMLLIDSGAEDAMLGGYRVVLQANRLMLQHTVAGTRGTRAVGTVAVPFVGRNDPVHQRVTLLVSRPEARFRVFLDGELAAEWTDEGRTVDAPGRLGWLPHGGNVRIDDLRIVTWDGEAPPAAWAVKSEAEDAPPLDRVFLRGGDRLSGDVLGVDHERVRMRTPLQDLAIVAEEVEQIDFAAEAAAEAGPRVRVEFPPHGRLTVEVERVADGVLVGRSALVGPVRIPIETVQVLDFLSPPESTGESASED